MEINFIYRRLATPATFPMTAEPGKITWAMGATFLTTLTAPLRTLPILSFWSASEEKERVVGADISKSGYNIPGYYNFIWLLYA